MTDLERTQIEAHPIILYDGVCALCNGVVRYLLRRDQSSHADCFRFIPQDTPLARELLAPFQLAEPAAPEGVILLTAALTPHQRLYRRSDAVAESLRLLEGPWSLLGRITSLIPRSLREIAYSLIARYRYRLFGRYPTCPIPTPAQKGRILGIQMGIKPEIRLDAQTGIAENLHPDADN